MGGGGLYEGLPHPHPTTSYWQSPLHKIANHRTTPDLPKSAQYVIVGSGITGMSIATKLLQRKPDADILMLEARTVCSGATGRNGGHCRPGFWTRFKRYYDTYGATEALKLDAFENDNIANVTDFIRSEGIDCDLHACMTADIWLDETEFDEALDNLRVREKVSAEIRGVGKLAGKTIYSGEDARKEFQMPEIAGGVTFHGYQMWPYKFVCGALEKCLAKGLNLQTTTPVLSVSHEPASSTSASHLWQVQTERGTIHASEVILATNAYTGALCTALSPHVIPTRAQVLAIRPGDKIASNPALQRTCGIEGRGLSDYMLSRPAGLQGEGDIIYGGGRLLSETGEQYTVDDSVVNPKIAAYLRGGAPGYFGKENWGESGRVLREWTGIMGYTDDKMPFIGEMTGQRGLWVCAGFNGHGMALTFQSAEALVQMVVDGTTPEWFPQSMHVSRVFK